MKKIWLIIFIALFFVACAIPMVGMLVAGPSPAAANEVQAVAPTVLTWEGKLNTAYFTDLRNYINNGFWQRLQFITAWDTLCAKLTNTSANEDVILGKDGWLFFTTSAETYAGADLLSDRETWCCARGLYLMQEYAESKGVGFAFVSPQGKETLYPEQMPDYTIVSDQSKRECLAVWLDEMGVNWADMYTPYVTCDEQLCYSWDSHWNKKGAALGADIILGALGYESDWFHAEYQTVAEHSGDLFEMLYPAAGTLEKDYELADGFTFTYESNFRTYDDMLIRTSCESGTGSLLVYRDSSGRNLYPYLAESAASAVFSRSNTYNMLSIDEYAATDVVIELADRNLNFITKYPGIYPAPERDASVLTGALRVSTTVAAEEDASVADLVKMSGALPAVTAVDSPVYLQVNGVVYEAIPAENGFTAWLPAGTQPADVTVYAFAA